jgi:hypothetical protein
MLILNGDNARSSAGLPVSVLFNGAVVSYGSVFKGAYILDICPLIAPVKLDNITFSCN